MPQKSGQYIRATVTDRRGLTVKGEVFDAISVGLDIRRITLDIGGLPTARGRTFIMPADPALLRDLAEALQIAAGDIEEKWAKRSGGAINWRPPVNEEELYY